MTHTPTKQSTEDKIEEILSDMLFDAIIDQHHPRHMILNDNDIIKAATHQLNLLLQAERKEGMKQNTGSIKRKLLEARLDELERTQQAIFKNLEIFRHTRKRIKELNHRLDKQE